MKSAKFSIAIIRRIITKLLAVSEILISIKFRLHWILFGIYHISAVIWKQKMTTLLNFCKIFHKCILFDCYFSILRISSIYVIYVPCAINNMAVAN